MELDLEKSLATQIRKIVLAEIANKQITITQIATLTNTLWHVADATLKKDKWSLATALAIADALSIPIGVDDK